MLIVYVRRSEETEVHLYCMQTFRFYTSLSATAFNCENNYIYRLTTFRTTETHFFLFLSHTCCFPYFVFPLRLISFSHSKRDMCISVSTTKFLVTTPKITDSYIPK